MIENQILKAKLKKELKKLEISEEQEEAVVKELNYLSNLLIDIYLLENKKEENSGK